ncbi:MAG: ABC transporter permease [Brevinematales bacterium]
MNTNRKLSINQRIRIMLSNFIRSQIFGILLILFTMVFALSIFTKTFLTSTNIFNILRAFSWIAISAFGQCLVIITGGIDLSVGSVMAFSGLISAILMKAGVYMPLAVLLGLTAGTLVGFLNGIMITKGKLPPFIATLGSLLMFRGLCYGISGGWPVRDFPESFSFFGQYDIPFLGIPMPLIFVILFTIIVGIFLSKTIWGYRIYAVGGNETAASLSGINTGKVKIMVYTLSAFLASVGGIIMTSRLGVAAPTAANGYELDVIAATVVGGTSLTGGEGNIIGVLVGALIMQVLRTGLVLVGVSAYWLQAIQGLVIVVAIMLDQLRKQRK